MSNRELTQTLDSLNAWGALEDTQACKLLRHLCFGPKAFKGVLPAPWVGVLIWRRERGYYGYRTLHLLGVWALAESKGVRVVVGTKTLKYSAPFYDAEAYHALIQRGFETYYKDKGSPPPVESQRFCVLYDPAERLARREQLRRAVERWAEEGDENDESNLSP